jgi:hypothetical protein
LEFAVSYVQRDYAKEKTMSDTELAADTTQLWLTSLEEGLLDELDDEIRFQIALGAHYAELCQQNKASLTDMGREKLLFAFSELSKLSQESNGKA